MVMAMAATAAAREAEGKKEDRAAQVASHQTRFQKIVLSWDYPRLLARSKINHKKQKGADQYKLHKVPDSFADLNEYLKVFESLLLEECRAQILRGDDDGLYLSILHGASVALTTVTSSYLLVSWSP
jgi:hypothetical protein